VGKLLGESGRASAKLTKKGLFLLSPAFLGKGHFAGDGRSYGVFKARGGRRVKKWR